MGSPFTKNTEGGQKNSNKLPLVLLLGGVLAGAVWYNWSSLAPRAAVAASDSTSPDAAAEAAPIPDNPQAIELALAALAQDPTAKLLRGHEDTMAYLDKPPANPFKLSRAWRSQLVKAAPAPIAVRVDTPQPRVHVSTFDPNQINLQSIFGSPAKRFALINGKPLSVGAVVAGSRITAISDKSITVQVLDDPSASPVEITLKH